MGLGDILGKAGDYASKLESAKNGVGQLDSAFSGLMSAAKGSQSQFSAPGAPQSKFANILSWIDKAAAALALIQQLRGVKAAPAQQAVAASQKIESGLSGVKQDLLADKVKSKDDLVGRLEGLFGEYKDKIKPLQQLGSLM